MEEEVRLSELVVLTRTILGTIVHHTETLGALIVLGVHSKDVTAELLHAGVRNAEEFEWVAQLRNYIVYYSTFRGAPL